MVHQTLYRHSYVVGCGYSWSQIQIQIQIRRVKAPHGYCPACRHHYPANRCRELLSPALQKKSYPSPFCIPFHSSRRNQTGDVRYVPPTRRIRESPGRQLRREPVESSTTISATFIHNNRHFPTFTSMYCPHHRQALALIPGQTAQVPLDPREATSSTAVRARYSDVLRPTPNSRD
jgi:hypothetical protein